MSIQSTDMAYLTDEEEAVLNVQPQNKMAEAAIPDWTVSFQGIESRLARLESSLKAQKPNVRRGAKSTTTLRDARISFIENRLDKSKGKRVDNEVEDFVEDDVSDNLFPITAKRIFKDDNRTIERTEIIIRNAQLQALLREVMNRYLKHEFQSTFEKKEIVLSSPFIPLLFNWAQLHCATTDPRTLNKHGEGVISDLKALLDLVQRLAPDYAQSWDNVLESKTVMLKYLFTIFRPGTLVVTFPYSNMPQLMKVHHYGAGSTSDDRNASSVFCEAYDWNGTKLERARYEFVLPKMDATEAIKVRELPCYPVEMYEDENGIKGIEALRKSLIERGQKFESLCISRDNGKISYQYDGKFLVEGDMRSGLLSDSSSQPTRLKLDIFLFSKSQRNRTSPLQPRLADANEVIIDFRSFREYGPVEARNGFLLAQTRITLCNCSLCISQESKDWIAGFGTEREKQDLIDFALLPPRVLGFALKSKLWGQFFINELKEPKEHDTDRTFNEELVFPDGKNDRNKEILKSLIMNHGNPSFDRITDSIRGKGQGLVLLFHGPPGVGKTMTAEALARSCRKPLLTVGIGDLGTTAETVEQSLSTLFDVITAWQGILLIDEADVFLDSRGSKGDVFPQQNAMVSVMLRLLEYFSGNLILTTNRVKSIDYAIMSRISYAVKFKALTIEHQKVIFENYLAQAYRKKNIEANEKQKLVAMIKSLKSNRSVNGREIRTLFTTAQLLGGGKLTAANMDEIREQQQDFKDDMNQMYILAEKEAVVQ